MTIAIAIVAALGFLAMCLKTWTEFGQRTRQLKAEIEHNKRLVEDHSEHLESGRSQVDVMRSRQRRRRCCSNEVSSRPRFSSSAKPCLS